jgi:hypothetical protein
MHRPSEINTCAIKLLFFQKFSSQNRRIVLGAVANLLRCRPAGYIHAGRYGAWRSLVAHLLFEQVVAKVKILEFDANGPWRPLCFRFIAVT